MTLYLGTSLIAGGMSAEALVDTLYPVGSCYIGTTSTCPLAAIKGTWTLQSSGIVTSVNTNVPIKGTGKTLGLTNGTNEVGFGQSSAGITYLNGNNLNQNVKSTSYGTTSTNGAFGIVTDASKSGIVGTITSTSLSVNIWQRTA